MFLTKKVAVLEFRIISVRWCFICVIAMGVNGLWREKLGDFFKWFITLTPEKNRFLSLFKEGYRKTWSRRLLPLYLFFDIPVRLRILYSSEIIQNFLYRCPVLYYILCCCCRVDAWLKLLSFGDLEFCGSGQRT